ncbi:DNA polymerase Y family protein [Aeromicrobium wangtongii]|uniref:DNA polymerase Y family protein n=1 Tax=Aeromicrobium wangtongii TaxID=2969247 RepID=A0ABY5M7U1_9ACTN|nr:DNA polymerase Y family protein [Aeromicrobium wangtongii]MCD9199240.1 DNA polymerase Y family protein [Aeromicrobium wangtongii]UUP12733.1 DNA polymerase Y family protein [Aeromicrobium wangtongii]
MARTMVLWAPDWPIVAVDVPASVPAAVIDKGQVLACSQAARSEGVRRGMRRRDAQSRCPGLVLHDHHPDADARAFEAVLTAIEELSPGVAPLRPGLCAIAVPSRFYGGEAEAAAVIAERLVGLGVWDVRAGVADGLFAAEQAARRALAQDSLVVPAGGSGEFLHDLPIDALDDADLVGLLRRMGLRTLGDFASLPPSDVHTRFGTHGALLHRLARGQDPHPISRRQVPPEFDATLVLEPPLDLVDPIAFSLRTTAEAFVTDLAGHGLVCTTVLIEVDADGSLASSRRWMHPRWFGPTDLVDRLRWQLSVQGAIRAPVDAVRLIPEVTEPLGDHADSLFGGGPDERVERGVARVQSIVGHESVVSVTVQGGRGPGERHLLTPWGERPVASRPAALPWPGSLPAPAPATVYPSPQQAMVVGAEGQPIGVSGRGVVTGEPARFRVAADQGWQPVAAWAGPWPVDDQWWDEAAARRIARFQVVGVDGSAFLMIVEAGQWWTEARYD